MTTDTHAVTKLATDGSNWVIYRDRTTSHFKSRHWVSHLTSTTIPQAYIAKGDVNGLTPDERWAQEEEEAMDMIGLSVPDNVFMAIKDNTTTMDTWNAVKDLFQNCSPLIGACYDK